MTRAVNPLVFVLCAICGCSEAAPSVDANSQVADATNQVADATNQVADATNQVADATNQVADATNQVADASTADASTADASTADASTADASTADASTADASTVDAMPVDAMPADAMIPDAMIGPDAPVGACVASGVMTFTNSVSTPIVDQATTTTSVAASGVDSFIARVAVRTFIRHTYNGDLSLTLISPTGSRVLLASRVGTGADDIFNGTLWTDVANMPVTDYSFTDGVFAPLLTPASATTTLMGENANGTWTLEVVDNASGDVGTIDSWALEIVALPVAPTFATTDFTSTAVLPIADVATTNSPLAVSGLPTELCDLRITTNISHGWSQDLDVTVISPMGTRVVLTTDNGGSNDNVFAGTTWSDAANEPVTEYVFADGVVATTLTAESALGAFTGEDPNGTWTLEVIDDDTGIAGTLTSWSVKVSTCTCP